MERDELLSKLQQVQEYVKKISGLQRKQIDLAVKYQRAAARAASPGSARGKLILGGIVAALGADLLVLSLMGRRFAVLAAALAALAIYALTWSKRPALPGPEEAPARRALAVFVVWAPYICGALLLLLALAMGETAFASIPMTLLTVLLFAGVLAVYFALIKRRSVSSGPRDQQLHSSEASQQYFQAVDAQKQLVQEMRRLGQGWYPEDCYTMEAAEFFVHAVRNFRAESVEEMVSLYECDGHKEAMEQKRSQLQKMQQDIVRNEAQILGELKYASVLDVMQLNMRPHTAQAVRESTAAASAAGPARKMAQGPDKNLPQ